MSSWLSDAVAAFRSPAPYVSWLAFSALLTVSGVFGADETDAFVTRFSFFGLFVGIALVWGIIVRVCLQRRWPGLGYWRASLIVVTTATAILSAPMHELAHVLLEPSDSTPHSVAMSAALVFVLGLSAAAIRWSLSSDAGSLAPRPATVPLDEPTAGSGVRSSLPRLLSRIDEHLRGDLIRVSGSNHHIEVITDKGVARLLMRLSDAIAEIDGLDGLQVHRSHWVSADAVTGAEKLGDKRLLVLRDGSRVPISRNQRAEVERRGFL